MPADEDAEMKHVQSIADIKVQGTTTLKGPNLSPRTLGMIPDHWVSMMYTTAGRWATPTSKHGCAVHDGEQVKCQVLVRDVLLQSIHLRVEERHVQPHEPAEETCYLQTVRWDQEGAEIEQRTRLWGQCTHTHARDRHDHGSENQKSKNARRPRETQGGKKAMENDGIDDAAKRRPRRCKADCQSDPGGEVC